MLTILVGKGGEVTANFALVQPSLQVDLPKVLQSVVAVTGGEMPKLETLAGVPQMMRSVTPNDLARTIYTLLSVDPDHELMTFDGRPVPVNQGGRLIRQLI